MIWPNFPLFSRHFGQKSVEICHIESIMAVSGYIQEKDRIEEFYCTCSKFGKIYVQTQERLKMSQDLLECTLKDQRKTANIKNLDLHCQK